uniref:Enoyl-CoA hydratase n=1 Tax=Chaetoceros debilis TaxID=122233 RepID=A0A7S3PTK7_9STRA|mmetsp:Transcript_22019/g.33469  ORF Transcript_22019/g.33469 Transcript_22019/m.33469 type:complete len:349 (+) Transcript_22019:32-1078(+)
MKSRQAYSSLFNSVSKQKSNARRKINVGGIVKLSSCRLIDPYQYERSELRESCQRQNLLRRNKHSFRSFTKGTSSQSIKGDVDNTLQEVLLEHCHESDIVTLTFNRAQRANAMGRVMLSQLQDILKELSGPRGNKIRCVILTSCNPKVFSAGADLKERSTMSREEASTFVSSLRDCFYELGHLPMPLIACIEGAAMGGGLEIAMTADIIICGDKARLGLPETSLAIIPGAGGTQLLPRLVGEARAKELIFSARKLDAKTAESYGIVQHVTPEGEAYTRAKEIALEVARNGPLAVRAAKMAIAEGMDCSKLEDGMKVERKWYEAVIPTDDRLEGLAAFKERRVPEYEGK